MDWSQVTFGAVTGGVVPMPEYAKCTVVPEATAER
jgi:hypothetical protein